jgi:hypothetical protein
MGATGGPPVVGNRKKRSIELSVQVETNHLFLVA